MLSALPPMAVARQTVPGGWPSRGSGPATPVVAMAQVAPRASQAPSAICSAAESAPLVRLTTEALANSQFLRQKILRYSK